MSILIAYKRGDTVYMATDTRVIVNEEKRSELCESSYKIQRLDNGMLVGCVGDRLTRQTLFAYPEIFSLDKRGRLTRKHIVEEIVPALYDLLNEKGLLIRREGCTPYMSGPIFLAHGGDLYEICRCFTVYRYENFQALGDASDFVQATLFAIKDSDDVNEKLVRALDIAAKNSYLVSRPYLLINTKEKEYTLVRSEIE